MSAQTAFLVTGTDTEIGKTLISSAMLHALAAKGLRAAGMKPVAAGAMLQDGSWLNEDVDQLMAASSVKLPVPLACPYLLREASAPHIVARKEGVAISLPHIGDCYARISAKTDVVIVEGVGGFRVPLSDHVDTADLAQQLALPIVLVVGLRLGCLNHALLTADAIDARGLVLAGWVANSIDPAMRYTAENVDALRIRLPAPLLGHVPRLTQPCAAAAAAHLDFSLLPTWPGATVRASVSP